MLDFKPKQPVRTLSFNAVRQATCFAAILILLVWVYWQTLNGPFVIDDWTHLANLGVISGQISWDALLTYSAKNQELSGRFLAMLTFLIDDYAWPSTPDAFRDTNILIHALNAVLVFWLALLLFKGKLKAPVWAALMACVLWAFSPIHVSTVAMIIQRMTLLAGAVMLSAIILYIYGRRSLLAGNLISGAAICFAAFFICYVPGYFLKQNTILFAAFVLVLEACWFGWAGFKNRVYKTLFITVIVPLCAIVFVALFARAFTSDAYDFREFSLYERVLTQTRVLWDYLGTTVLFQIHGSGPYQDDVVISTSLISPLSTLLSILTWIAVIAASLILRKKNSLPLFALSWFLVGHSLESTILPLEIAFEHRNYIPTLGLFVAFAFGVARVYELVGSKRSVVFIFLLYASLGVFQSYQLAKDWSHPLRAARIWHEESPQSIRAAAELIGQEVRYGTKDNALAVIDGVIDRYPDRATFVIKKLNFLPCSDVTPALAEATIQSVKRAIFDFATTPSIKELYQTRIDADCPLLDDAFFFELVSIVLANPNFEGDSLQVRISRSSMYEVLSKLYVRRGDLNGAVSALDKAYEMTPRYEFAARQAYWLLTAGLIREAEKHRNKAADTPVTSVFDRPDKAKTLNILDDIFSRIEAAR